MLLRLALRRSNEDLRIEGAGRDADCRFALCILLEVRGRDFNMSSQPENVLEIRGLRKTYTQGRWWQKRFHCRALDEVNLSLPAGNILALVGESGCGKTTLAMCLVGLEKPDAGEIFFNGTELRDLRKLGEFSTSRNIQLVFQDSAGSLNPRMSAVEIVEEPLLINGQGSRAERRKIAEEMMERVEMSRTWGNRRPHEFSGGQRQRLAIARALVLRPKILILDEVLVGLDISTQGQIANLLLDMQEQNKLSYICISHNLALVSHIADTVAFMDKGRVVEVCGRAEAAQRIRHSYGDAPLKPHVEPLAVGAGAGA
jgi:ABC-type glutathione transport system ATPase component